MLPSPLKSLLALTFMAFSVQAGAQVSFTACPQNITLSAAPDSCSATVTFTQPVASSNCPGPNDSATYNYTGSPQMFVVPAGVAYVTAHVYGAQGGSNDPINNNYGGFSQGDITVNTGDTLWIYVGNQPTGIAAGYNGGGAGETGGAGGGGASDIRYGGTTLNDRILVAGGGGGAGYWSGQHVVGGVGGGTVGGDGYRSTTTNPGGQGGTQTASGTGTCVSLNNPSTAGGFGFGGSPSGCGCEGYGGGGGWYGGAGSGNCRGGGGGSGYTHSSLTNASMTSGVNTGDGLVKIYFYNPANPPSTIPATLVQTAGLPDGSVFPVGITTQSFLAYTPCGDSAWCTFDIEVLDNTPPSISCPADEFTCLNVVGGIAPVSVLDNCNTTLLSYHFSGATSGAGNGNANNTFFNAGVTTLWYIAADASGNRDSCTFNVVVNAPDTAVTVSGATLQSAQVGGAYQWLDCDSMLPISGQTSASYTPAANGNFAVIVTLAGCTDTSSCYSVTGVGMNELSSGKFSLYPNPAGGKFILKAPYNEPFSFRIHDARGRLVLSDKVAGSAIIELSEPPGLYLVTVRTANGSEQIRLVIR